MKVTSRIEIKHINKLFRDTIKIYHDAISFCVKVFEENWEVLETLETGKKGLPMQMLLFILQSLIREYKALLDMVSLLKKNLMLRNGNCLNYNSVVFSPDIQLSRLFSY